MSFNITFTDDKGDISFSREAGESWILIEVEVALPGPAKHGETAWHEFKVSVDQWQRIFTLLQEAGWHLPQTEEMP